MKPMGNVDKLMQKERQEVYCIEGYTMTEAQSQAMYNDVYKPIDDENNERNRSNNRLLSVLERMFGNAYRKNITALFKDCEVGCGLLNAKIEIVRNKCGNWQNEKYGRHINGYWVDQWSVGTEGDSFEGYIYVKVKNRAKYLKVPFSC